MGLELHISEGSRGRWTCSLGDRRCDTHHDLGAAVRHMQAEAAEIDETALWIHFRDGTTEPETTLPALPDA